MGEEGAQHLAKALQNIMVNILLSSLPFLFSISNTDIDRTLPL
jgi:hypothetical protein